MYTVVIASVILNILLIFAVIKLYRRDRVDYEPFPCRQFFTT